MPGPLPLPRSVFQLAPSRISARAAIIRISSDTQCRIAEITVCGAPVAGGLSGPRIVSSRSEEQWGGLSPGGGTLKLQRRFHVHVPAAGSDFPSRNRDRGVRWSPPAYRVHSEYRAILCRPYPVLVAALRATPASHFEQPSGCFRDEQHAAGSAGSAGIRLPTLRRRDHK